MNYRISHPTKNLIGSISLTASKSESNRLLIIQALCKQKFAIDNLALAQDTQTLQQILSSIQKKQTGETFLDVGPAGTTMRFLTAFLATQSGTFILTGSERMKKRPIGILVNALRQLGASIEYMNKEGFAPLKITGKLLKGGEVEMDANVSSQYISALLLIAPELQNGLVIRFKDQVTSKPYINMTLNVMEAFNVFGQWYENGISVSKQNYRPPVDDYFNYTVEADWSSASYWYAIAALSKEVDFIVKGLKHPSLQGDSIVPDLFTFFGVKTEYVAQGVHLSKINVKTKHFGFDFTDCPDLVQTIAVVASALRIPCLFNGVRTLRIKETDRIQALRNELFKLGVDLEINNENSFSLIPNSEMLNPQLISTYDDHRMAMAFSTLAMKLENSLIEQPEVVRKSYPNYWDDLKSLEFLVEEV